jgi:hypothetical protein
MIVNDFLARKSCFSFQASSYQPKVFKTQILTAMLKVIACLCLGACIGAHSFAQQAASASGGHDTGLGSTVSPTSGQPENSSYIGNAPTKSEGVDKSLEIQTVSQQNPENDISLESEASLYPASDFLLLKVNRDEIENMKYQLSDLNGKVLEEAFIGDIETNISLKPYRPNHYLLMVTDNSVEIVTFKISKIKKP